MAVSLKLVNGFSSNKSTRMCIQLPLNWYVKYPYNTLLYNLNCLNYFIFSIQISCFGISDSLFLLFY